ncbi:hypothetical protein BC938DRAFT_474199 [Jimgerdemannia flammicorona]|uniref:Uncharacterized protein n=1 Tax=Jimgerdemannia flammicorona TaxID=994334 RepID=A0A433QZK0_9FUNG|nr:hypothetical protein BC938DRAFT_474199 [Jimgerdemannia flammicorona]
MTGASEFIEVTGFKQIVTNGISIHDSRRTDGQHKKCGGGAVGMTEKPNTSDCGYIRIISWWRRTIPTGPNSPSRNFYHNTAAGLGSAAHKIH